MAAQLPADLAANTVEVDAPGSTRRRSPELLHVVVVRRLRQGALEAVAVEAPPIHADWAVCLVARLRAPGAAALGQSAFAVDGRDHATGLFDRRGGSSVCAEDVGRHNAMDKVIGWAFGEDLLPLAERSSVSGRLSFELVQKAASRAARSSSRSARRRAWRSSSPPTADPLCGFVRGDRVNVYTCTWRLSG